MILAAGLSPAWQQILVFDRFVPGGVNRAAETHACASGKVINVGLALAALRAESHTLSVIGGATGREIRAEFATKRIPATWIETTIATRICTTILDRSSGETTELVENTSPLESDEIDRFRAEFRKLADAADTIVVTGSSPVETPAALYRDLLAGVSARCVLDIRGPELLAALECRPFLVKPNREELAATVGRDLSDESALLNAMRELNDRGAEWVVVTDGANPVWMTSREETRRFVPPVAPVVNPIGCGDCLAAGIAWATGRGQSPMQAVQIGIAAALENAAQLLPARLNSDAVRSRAADITPERF